MINCLKDFKTSKNIIKKQSKIAFGILLQNCNILYIHEYAN